MERLNSRVTEDLLTWLETDDALKENPEALKLKSSLVEKLAVKKRRISAASESSSESNGNTILCIKNIHRIVSNPSEMQLDNGIDGINVVRNGVNTARYKTELCRSFSENGFCRYNDKCQFAHGILELRQTARHPRYKTELCKAYHMSGFCPYGARCNFIHNDVDVPSRLDGTQCKRHLSAASTAVVRTLTPWNGSKNTDTTTTTWPSRVALGSTVDSPPQSVTDSPTPSPTAMLFDPAFDSLPSLWAAVVGQK